MSNLPSNLWKSSVIKNRLTAEACFECNHGISLKKHYWVQVPESDTKTGSIELKNYKAGIQDCDPHEMQQQFAISLQRSLMENANFDGLWIVGFTHPPSTYEVLTDTGNCWNRLIMIWLDEDGDPQFTVESDRDFANMLEDSPEYWIERAVEAYQAYLPVFSQKALKQDFLLKEGEHQKREALEALN